MSSTYISIDAINHSEQLAFAIELMSQLENSKLHKGDKDVGLLSMCQQVSRTMNGGRMTCCKSGKDRTSMSVTLECATLLSKEAEIAGINPIHLLSVLRRRGVRVSQSSYAGGRNPSNLLSFFIRDSKSEVKR